MSTVLLSGNIFDTMANQASHNSSLSGGALSNGIDAYIKKDYEGAVKAFRRAIRHDPHSDNALKAYDFMAQAYLQMGREIEAESSYRQALKLNPNSVEMHTKLANLYFSQKKYSEAESEYLSAIKTDPYSPDSIYALGQLYLTTNRVSEAEIQFKKILDMLPDNYGAHYSLGQTYAKQGEGVKAITEFKRSIELNAEFTYAYLDLGIAYTDQGDMYNAELQAQKLDSMDSAIATDLRNYIQKMKKPGIFFATTFADPVLTTGPGTEISSWDNSLSIPNSSTDFILTVYFDKEMDRTSVENIANWKIGRSSGIEQGGAYNWGLPLPSTEISLPSLPKNVYYDAQKQAAQVIFTVNQNNTCDGTIDPSHIVFGFYGKDAYGNVMDRNKDEYVGLSIIV